jgi:membrane fusion protein, multidrug efflux system
MMSKQHLAGVFTAQAAIVTIATSLTLLLAACSKPAPAPEPVRAVKVMTVAESGAVASHEYSAEVRARAEVRVGFRVGGKIIKRQADVGERVKAGQVIAQLDPSDLALGAASARAGLQAAATNRDLAAADFKRFADLRAQNFISEAELQRREATLRAAQAQLDQAKAQLSVQGNQAAYAVLTAPVAGIITAVEAEVGQVVAAGAPVLRIAQDGARDAVFSVPEDRLSALKVGDSASIRTWGADAPGVETKLLEGKVHELAASADPVTRTYLVKVAIGGNDAPALGSTVYVSPEALSAKGLEVIKLPTSALRQDGKASAVWLLDKTSMTVKSQTVTVATADGNEAVIADGLKAGDLVVTAGVHVLAAGQKVTLYKEKSAIAGENTAQDATKKVANSAATATK